MQQKSTLLCILVLLSPILSIGQTNFFSLLWDEKYQHTQSNNYSNEARKVLADEVNNTVYILADFTSDMDPNGVVTGSTYHYVSVLLVDEFGIPITSKLIDNGMHQVDGFDYKGGFGLETDNAGNIYVGYTSYDPTTGHDINITKLSSQLVQLWNYKFNPISDETGIDLKVTGAGQAYAIVKSIANVSNIRHRIIKATGAGVSTVPFYNFNSGPDYLNSLAIDNVGNIYVTGYRLIFGTKSILIASVTQGGILRWLRTDNCGTVTGDDEGKQIVIGQDGYVYITGSSVGTIQHGIDVVTMKFNSTQGKKFWQNFINYNLADGAQFIDASDIDFVVVGWSASTTIFVDQIFANSGASGKRATYNPVPDSPYSGLDNAVINDMVVSQGDIIYIAGTLKAFSPGALPFSTSFATAISFATRGSSRIIMTTPVEGDHSKSLNSVAVAVDVINSKVYHASNFYETYTTHTQEFAILSCLKSSSIVRMANSNISTQEVSIYPTPAIDKITINSELSIESVEIHSISGQLVSETSYSTENYMPSVDVSHLSTGVYFAKVKFNDGSIETLKLLKD